MKKSILKILLVAIFVFSALALGGCNFYFNPSTLPNENGFVFDSYGDGCMVDKYVGSDSNVVIPEQNSYGKSVLRIDNDAFDGYNIKSVVIPKTVVEIGRGAFSSCKKLEKVEFQGTLQQWCEIALDNSPLVQTQQVDLYINGAKISGDIVIENGPTTISTGIFYNQSDITSISIPSSVEIIEASAFRNLDKITSITLSEGLTTIESHAFSGCKAIQELTFPQSLTTIESHAFDGCEAVQEITFLSTNLNDLGSYAFSNMKQLRSIVLPNTLESIGEGWFKGCENLETVVTPQTFYSIETSAFDGCTKLKEITLPSTLNRIGSYAFRGCKTLKEITLPEEITYINERVFDNCTALETVVCKANLTEIDNGAFSGCVNLKTIKKADGSQMPTIEEFGDACFYNCQNLETFFIGEETQSIGYRAFASCNKLRKVVLGENTEKINRNAFEDCVALVEFYAPSVDMDFEAPWFSDTVALEKLTAPYEIVSALQNKTALEEVCLTTGETLSANEFNDCTNLKKVYLPGTITEIASSSFAGDSAITDIYFQGTMDDWCRIVFGAPLANCTDNLYINNQKVVGENCPEIEVEFSTQLNYNYYLCKEVNDYAFYGFSGLKKIVLHDEVTKIGDYAFKNCPNLEEIQFGVKCNHIYGGAFENCTSLNKVNYIDTNTYTGDLKDIGTMRKWCEISFDDYAACPTYYGAQIHFNGTALPSELTLNEYFMDIGKYAFANQKALTSITIDYTNSTNIGVALDTFVGCSNVTYAEGSAKLFNSLFDDDFDAAQNLETAIIVEPKMGGYLKDELFKNCESLSNVQISMNVTNIGRDAFVNTAYYNDASNWINGVLYIDSAAFGGLSSSENIYAVAAKPEAVTNGTLALESTAKYIADYTFANMGIEIIPSSVDFNVIGEGAFMDNKIQFLDLSSIRQTLSGYDPFPGVQRVGAYAFANNTRLIDLTLNIDQFSTHKFSSLSFRGCDNILRIYNKNTDGRVSSEFSFIPHKYMLTSKYNHQFRIENDWTILQVDNDDRLNSTDYTGVFADYTGTAEAFDTSSVSYDIIDIWAYAFEEKNTLKSLKLGNNLNYENVILNCANLESVTFTDSINSINGKSISGCDKLTKIYAPVGTWSDGTNTFVYSSESDAEGFAQFVIGKDATITKATA